MKTLYSLVVIYNGFTFNQYTHLPLEHCVARLMMERREMQYVQKTHPEINLSFKCEPEHGG